MSFRQIVRNYLIDQLPAPTRLFMERQYFGRYFVQEKRLFQSNCASNRTAVDVGANKGDMSLFLSQYSLKVHAFEPVPDMARKLRYRFRDCNVTVYDCAIGASKGQGTLRIPSFGSEVYTTRSSLLQDLDAIRVHGEGLTKLQEIPVPIATLDDFDLGPVGFVKIDVEGYELDVLQGAMQTIKTHRPALYVEIEQRRHPNRPISDMFGTITELGYSGWFVRASKLFPLAYFETEKMQDPSKESSPEFVNNFLFKPIH
jgi:FkbM family methyltransferase